MTKQHFPPEVLLPFFRCTRLRATAPFLSSLQARFYPLCSMHHALCTSSIGYNNMR
ncbi:MAG: hypothetical protein KF852_00230 [Saprospiraceae bacterium]|nr:hypothetical protein [Saprospiraceae bacterium]